MRYLHDYGVKLPVRMSDRMLEGFCFLHELGPDRGGLGTYEHLKNYIFKTWPKVENTFDPWLEWKLRALADPELGVTMREESRFRNISWTGAAAAGKTYSAALYAYAWWSADPNNSAAILCSSSKGSIRRRVWPVFQQLYSDCQDNGKSIKIGHIVDSQTKIQSVKGDDLHAMFALAVEQGELMKAIGLIKGIHTKRILLVVDEADSTQPAIYATIPNLRKGCQDFTLLSIGNAVNMLDPHGTVCEPLDGWDSITVDSDEWPTAAVTKWNVEPGHCLHFDGAKSPNVKARKTLYPYLYTYEDHQAALARPDYVKSIGYWSFERGFWASEGAADRIITPQLIVKTKAREKFTWLGSRVMVGALDPAFGGNDCVLMFGWMGDTVEHASALEVTEIVKILVEAKSPDPIDYQIAKRVMLECQVRGVSARYFGLDVTGTGRGVAAFLAMHWSADISKIEFGGNASDAPFVDDDMRPAKEVCFNRVTELWWRIRSVMAAGRLRGIYDELGQQLCMRPYTLSGRRYRVVPKDEMKELNGKSPDEGDALAILVEVARRHGLSPDRKVAPQDQNVTNLDRLRQEAWEEVGTAADKVEEFA